MKHQFVEKKTDRGLTNRGSRGDYAAQLRLLLDVELQHCCNPVEVLLPCTVLHMQGLNLVSFSVIPHMLTFNINTETAYSLMNLNRPIFSINISNIS